MECNATAAAAAAHLDDAVQVGRGLLVLRRQALAMPAPRGVELHNHHTGVLQNLVLERLVRGLDHRRATPAVQRVRRGGKESHEGQHDVDKCLHDWTSIELMLQTQLM